MIGLRTSRYYENANNNKIALNFFQGDINDFNENDECNDMLTKRGKVKNKSKIEYFKNYINNFKEIKFKTARQIEIFRKKEDKNKKDIKEKKENLDIINENTEKEQNINKIKFNLIKETFQEGREAQLENINNINNKKNEMINNKHQKIKNTKKEIANKIIRNNEELLNKLKKNKNKTKYEENEKDKMKKKIMKLKEKNKKKNLSTEKIFELFDKDNEKFLKLIKAKKMRKIKNKISKSFNNSYKKDVYFNKENNQAIIPIIKSEPNDNNKRNLKEIENKFKMKILNKEQKYIDDISERDIINQKRQNKVKTSIYLSKSCSNNKENIKSNKKVALMCKNQKQFIKKRTIEQNSDK